jgi:hypothetical protein
MICIKCPKENAGKITEDHRKRLKAIKRDILALDPTLERYHNEFRRAVLILAAGLIAGPSVERLVELTSYSPLFVQQVHNNMRAVGLWTDEKIVAPWLNEDDTYNATGLWIHALVAQGKLTAREHKKRGWIYKAM